MEGKLNSLLKFAGNAAKTIKDSYDGVKDHITQVQVYNVINAFDNMVFRKAHYTTEKHVEETIANKLADSFDRVHRQYNIGGYLGLKVDVDIEDGRIGIEIKLAKELDSAACIERLFGQVLYYSRRVYKQNLIVLVVGTKKEYGQKIKEIEAICTEQHVTFYYLEVS